MKKRFVKLTALLATVLLSLSVQGESNATKVEPVGKDLSASPENVAPAFHNEIKEQELPALNYVNQPPMIPHSVKHFQVNKNVNQCLNCHSPEASRVTGATRISPTHFMDRDGNISAESSPRRYFCLQCHVSQSNVEPIIKNEFKAMPGFGK